MIVVYSAILQPQHTDQSGGDGAGRRRKKEEREDIISIMEAIDQVIDTSLLETKPDLCGQSLGSNVDS